MNASKRRYVTLCSFLVLVVLGGPGIFATTVHQMNLQELCEGSVQIYRGTVRNMTGTTIQVGGGSVPAVTYTIEVTDPIQGSFPTVKDVQVAEITLLGTEKQHLTGEMPIPGLPSLKIGGDYLLMVAPAGPVGLTSTMGLGQGCFEISGHAGEETAVNSFDNVGLFKGMSVAMATTTARSSWRSSARAACSASPAPTPSTRTECRSRRSAS